MALAGCPGAGTAPSPGASAFPLVPGASKAVPIGARPIAITASGGFVYVVDGVAGTVAAFDTATAAVALTLPLEGARAVGVRAFPDRRHVIVADGARNEAIVVDAFGHPRPAASVAPTPGFGRPETPKPTPTPSLNPHQVMQRVALGGTPGRMAFTSDGREVLVALDGGRKVLQLRFGLNRWNPPNRRELALAVGDGGLDAGGSTSDAAGGVASGVLGGGPGPAVGLVPDVTTGKLLQVDLATGTTKALTMLKRPGPVAYGTFDGRPLVAIAGDREDDVVRVTDTGEGGSDRLVTGVGRGPAEVVVDQETKRAFVTMDGSNELAVIDYDQGTLVTKLALPGRPTALSLAPPVPHEVWVATDGGQLAVVAGKELRVKATVPIGKGPHALTFWGTKGYCANAADGTLSVVDRIPLR